MSREEFERLVEEGYERLPEWVRQKIKNVALLVEDEPSPDVRKRERLGRNHTLLGYYQGIPLSARGEHYGVGATLPDTITLYQRPIEEAAVDELRTYEIRTSHVRGYETRTFDDAVRQIIADTIWHEFAHHFGMDEHEVRTREKNRNHKK